MPCSARKPISAGSSTATPVADTFGAQLAIARQSLAEAAPPACTQDAQAGVAAAEAVEEQAAEAQPIARQPYGIAVAVRQQSFQFLQTGGPLPKVRLRRCRSGECRYHDRGSPNGIPSITASTTP